MLCHVKKNLLPGGWKFKFKIPHCLSGCGLAVCFALRSGRSAGSALVSGVITGFWLNLPMVENHCLPIELSLFSDSEVGRFWPQIDPKNTDQYQMAVSDLRTARETKTHQFLFQN
jgi:hypothetical protein